MVLNNCKFLAIALGLCAISNTGCQCMADPQSCPNYDESFDHPWPNQSHPDWVDRIDKVESLTEFTSRIEGELDGLGIRVEKIEETEEAPDWF